MMQLLTITKKPYKKYGIRTKKIRDRYLVTNDYGSFVDLSEEEHRDYISNNLHDKLFDKLEEKGIILTKDNEQRIAERYRKKTSYLDQGTSLHIIVVTLRCNFKCVYCHSASKPMNQTHHDMSLETAKKTVDFIFQSPSHYITIEFQGGEPTLNLSAVKFITKYAKELNKVYKKDLRFSIVTNMSTMNEKILEYLLQENIGICTSLDGPKEVHDKNRFYIGGKGTHDTVKGWIKKIKKKNPTTGHALATITRYTLPYYKELIQEYIDLNYKFIWLRPVNKLGFAKNSWKKTSYTAQEFIEFYKNSIDHIIKNKLPIIEKMTWIMLKKILTDEDPNYLDLRATCGAAIGQMAYMNDGGVYSCDEGRMVGDDTFKIGTVDQKFKEIMDSKEVCNLVSVSTNDGYLCDDCAYKPYCGVCPACHYSTTGNLRPNLATDDRHLILEGIFTYLFEKLLFDKEYSEVFEKWAKVDDKHTVEEIDF
ncbi:His-Xaa-Ser system radical SAM maturase HxsB [Candidatus Woesearchaeota archaeon]|nr:His-Xaa-Ser system radical SAM maturase HxsB [Candidatus Woesearchaeota archaeon]